MNNGWIVVACIVGVTAVTSAAQPPQMPEPGPEQQALQRWVGTWRMSGTASDSPLGPGGQVTGTETCRMFEGGWHLVCETEGNGPWGAMKGLAILTWDRAAKQYRYVAINNMPDAEIATGTRDGKRWTFTSSMNLGGKTLQSRFTITEVSPVSDSMKWEVSGDGTSWNTVMEGTSTKTPK